MPSPPPSTSPNEAALALAAYQQALLRTRPRWHTLAFVLIGLFLGFFAPVAALCGWLPQSGIVWGITGTTLATGLGYWGAAWLLGRRSRDNRLIDDLLLSGTLVIAAGLLWAEMAVQSGPVRGRTLEFWPSLAIVLLAAFAGVFLMHRRAARLAAVSGSNS
jgi:peptidoglycan/LPS O-acetylase OafA/YrhL